MNVYIGGPKTITVSDMQGPAPDGFHIPLQTEWQGLIDIGAGLGLTTGDTRRINLHMPFAGLRDTSSASIGGQGSYGYYWSSSPYVSDQQYARYLNINSSNRTASVYNARANGFSVRCFKNSFEKPTSSWTIIYGTLGGAGIFWNQTEGIISITSNGATGYTIQDKNLGATSVYNNGDTLSEANCGKYYQWGNNYGFAWTGSVTTSSTQVNAQNYGPGNYYSGSTFITGNNDWSSVHNDNLRGGTSQGTSTKTVPQEVKNIYIGEYPPTYTVNWKNYDDTILETDLKVLEGTTPTYDSATPTRTGYEFTGWSPTPAPIYADTDYTAQFVQSVTTTYNFKTGQQGWYWASSETTRGDSDYLSGKGFYWFNTSSSYCGFWYGCPSTISGTIKEVTQKFYVPYSGMGCGIAVSNTGASIHVRTDGIYVRKNNSAGFSKHTSLSLSVGAHTVKYDFTHSGAIYVYIDSGTTPYIINDGTATDEKYNNLFKTGWTNKTFRIYVYSLPNRGDTYNYAYIESLVTKT